VPKVKQVWSGSLVSFAPSTVFDSLPHRKQIPHAHFAEFQVIILTVHNNPQE
jgi:hypothetical protein